MQPIFTRLKFIAGLMPADQIAIQDDSEAITYKELFRRIEQCSQWIRSREVRCLGLYADNSIDWVIADLACQEVGITCIPLPMFFSEEQLRRCIHGSGIDFILGKDPEIMPSSTAGVAEGTKLQVIRIKKAGQGITPKGTQKVTFTSGSTGAPKGVCLSLDHQWEVAESLADRLNINRPRHLCLLPLSTLLENIAGIYSPLLSGGTVLVPGDFQRGFSGSSSLDINKLLGCISSNRPNSIILIPQLLGILIQAASNGWMPPDSLKFIAVGGGKVSTDLIIRARRLGLPVYQGYGLSECGSVVALNTPQRDRKDSVGKILPHCKVSIDPDGEIKVAGAIFLGYLDSPETWYPKEVKTGDLGDVENSFLQVKGRKKNILITSFGRNISPEWVESEILSNLAVQQCMVVGDGRPYLTALISADKNFSNQQLERWIQNVNARLPDYARVQQWERIESSDFLGFLTENGRLKRSQIEHGFSRQIDRLYPNVTQYSNQRMVLP